MLNLGNDPDDIKIELDGHYPRYPWRPNRESILLFNVWKSFKSFAPYEYDALSYCLEKFAFNFSLQVDVDFAYPKRE